MNFFSRVREDIRNVIENDPAARSRFEIVTCYSGLHAIWIHRINHGLWKRNFRTLARFLSQFARFLTGIEIHPGATIGRRFFIDHGMGVVIGETAEIGDDVLLYQGVVLGGVSLEKAKRHPTLEDNVVVGAGAIILGPITIGKNARVGAGSVVLKPVPPGATVVGVPGRVVGEGSAKAATHLEHNKLPDPIAQALAEIQQRNDALEEKMKQLEARMPK